MKTVTETFEMLMRYGKVRTLTDLAPLMGTTKENLYAIRTRSKKGGRIPIGLLVNFCKKTGFPLKNLEKDADMMNLRADDRKSGKASGMEYAEKYSSPEGVRPQIYLRLLNFDAGNPVMKEDVMVELSRDWIQKGFPHHVCVVNGQHATKLEALARHCNVKIVQISCLN